MKFLRILVFSVFFMPMGAFAASSDFMMAAQLLAAAKAADIQQVQSLVNNGANINFVDSTGVSIVCTALMNNDVRAAQILQMYGADASKCDRQIRQYKNKTKTGGGGGLFSGLSSAQSISLAAAGAAVVVGGLFLLTDVLDPGNDNDSSAGGGDRPDNNPGTDGDVGMATAYVSVPYSPAYLGIDGKITTSNATYLANLEAWNPDAGGIRQLDYNYFRPLVQTENNYVNDGILVPLQNYLLMMHGYSAFANEYMGQGIFRDATTRNPVPVANDAGGGRPVIVGLVTDNGVAATGSLGRGDGVSYTESAAANATPYLVDKFANYNNPTVPGGLGTEIAGFDLSGSGTALNPYADASDSALGKIVAGWEAGGRTFGDLMGFVPNGRLGIFRTGGGQAWQNIADPDSGTVQGTLSDAAGGIDNQIEVGDKITLNGVTYDIMSPTSDTSVTNPTIVINGTEYKIPQGNVLMKGVCVAVANGGACDDVSDIAIYAGVESQGTDIFYYVNTTGGNTIDAVYSIVDGNIYNQKTLADTDYKNYQALFEARSVSDVLANVSVLDVSREISYLTTKDMPALLALSPATNIETFVAQMNSVYDREASDVNSQGGYANTLFNAYNVAMPILVMPAGEFEYGGGTGKSLSVLDATFENYAPLLYNDNLEHMFMTVVAVRHTSGTTEADSIGEYGNGVGAEYGPLYLSMWRDANGTLDDASDDVDYMSRKCGVAGTGGNGIDPWCFAAAGPTAEMATAAAAGAVASLKGAFGYMSNPQIFMLMALTADGYLLGTDGAGNHFTDESLASYLQSMYSLPPEYGASSLNPSEYLKAFADVYGYGLINLERAMTPNKSVYFYDGTNIVSADGNAYWRAAQGTVFRPSGVLNLRGATIRAPFFDVLESVDGSMSLPRVWENEFALGSSGRHGLYMGDVLGELRTRQDSDKTVWIGNLGMTMGFSEKLYADNLNGLDDLTLNYKVGNWDLGASYQRYFTNGQSRFTGLANPVLGLATNAIVSDLGYNMGAWSFGVHGFSGAITDEGLLENDPTIAAQYMPAKLGLIQGGTMDATWNKNAFSLSVGAGMVHENNTVLGAYTDGLLKLGNGDTVFVDAVARYEVSKDFNFVARATFARTQSDESGDFILGMTDIDSNAFAFGANIGNFEFSVAQPLAITDGDLQYAFAEYDVVETNAKKYDLSVVDAYVANIDLEPEKRELRFMGTYRHSLGHFTDAALGFIYRVNPNHTDEFGNESVFMMKLTHRLGI